jgi:eukaryotic-like serine/threonine-protein kinase
VNEPSDSASEGWREALDCVDDYLARSDEERPEYLAEIERTRPELYTRVRALLDADERASRVGFMDVKTVRTPVPGMAAAAALRAGERLGPYRIERELGQGGMGEVWLARRDDGLYQGEVAIKTLHPYFAHGAMRDRFLREAELLGKLAHPNIARLLDAGVSDGVVYLVLEYVRGEPLDGYCDTRKLGVGARLELFAAVCAAVAHAHANLVVHRDIKPSNILVTTEGHVKLLDFGIGKFLAADADDDRTELTRITGRVFTPDFAAPEQILGEPVTTATDVYALGVLLYVLLAGVRPFSAGDTSAVKIEHAVLHDEPKLLARAAAEAGEGIAAARASTSARLKRELEGDLDDIVSRALRKTPAERYASVAALSDDVLRFVRHEPVLARAGSRAYRMGRFVRRHRVAAAATAGVLLAAIVGVAGVVYQAREARVQARVAELEASKQKAVKDFLLGIFNANSARHPDGARARLTTAEELLDVASQGVLANPPQQAEVRDELLELLGDLNATVDKFELAESLLRERVRFVAETSGRGTPRHAEAQLELAHLLYTRSKNEEGNPVIEEALATIKAAGLENSLLHGHAEYEKAFGMYMAGSKGVNPASVAQSERAVHILEKLPPSPQLAAAYSVLSRNYQNSNMIDEAIAADARTIELATQVLGPRDPMVSDALRHASRTLAGRFRIREAEDYLARAVEIATFVAGPDSMLAVEAEMDRAHMMVMRGGHRELAALEKDLLPRAIKIDGENADNVQIVKFLLGTALLQVGDIDRSRVLMSEAIAASEQNSSISTVPAMLRVRAAGALVQGRAAAALADVDRALEMTAKVRRGPPNYRSATMLATRAEALIALGRAAEARAVLADTKRILAKGEADPVKPYTLQVDLVEASADLSERRPEVARATAERVLAALAPQSRRAEFWVTEELAHRQLAAALFALGEKAEACQSLDAAIALRTANALAQDPRLIAARKQREACGA